MLNLFQDIHLLYNAEDQYNNPKTPTQSYCEYPQLGNSLQTPCIVPHSFYSPGECRAGENRETTSIELQENPEMVADS